MGTANLKKAILSNNMERLESRFQASRIGGGSLAARLSWYFIEVFWSGKEDDEEDAVYSIACANICASSSTDDCCDCGFADEGIK